MGQELTSASNWYCDSFRWNLTSVTRSGASGGPAEPPR